MRKRKYKLKAKFYWNRHNFHAWNGLIIAGKDRAPRLLKYVKPMTLIYVYCYYDWPKEGTWLYGLGYYLGYGFVYFRDVLSGGEYFITVDQIEWFDIPKFVGGKDIYKDATDDETLKRAISFKERIEKTDFLLYPHDPSILIHQSKPYD